MKNIKSKSSNLDKKQVIAKIEYFCAYQERSQQEVRDRLYELSLHKDDVEEIISLLIINNFLNEERFTISYVGGKFRIKKWGKNKIKQGLRLKKIPEKMIQKALNEINDQEYLNTIIELVDKKSLQILEKDAHKKKIKIINYLQSKGFENDLIFDALKNNNLT